MRVVSDTSPIHYLVLIGEARVLPALFGTLSFPIEVIRELAHSRSPDAVREWAMTLPAWAEVADQASSLADPKLGPGESAAIAMALDRAADLLLIDERYGTRVARDLGLTTVGTVGILAVAAGKGLVSLRTSFDALRATSFRGPDGLMEELIRMDENRSS
jgi:predicted nucleic acid-binding protein